jgi:hypothetical protein
MGMYRLSDFRIRAASQDRVYFVVQQSCEMVSPLFTRKTPLKIWTSRSQRMPRMKILNSIEQEAFELPPLLNSAERKRHFDFPVAILQIAAELRTAANQLCFLLSCGYFRACKRLIKNCIICWNYLYLSQKLAEMDDPERREAILNALTHGSAVSWQHINLLGEYDFSEERLQDTVAIKPPKLQD